jgi:hypothetical protein
MLPNYLAHSKVRKGEAKTRKELLPSIAPVVHVVVPATVGEDEDR